MTPLESANAPDTAAAPASLEALLDVTLPVAIEIGRTQRTVDDLLQLAPGAVLTLDRGVGEPVDVLVGERRFALGEVVVVGDRLGVRITKLVPAAPSEGEA